MNSINRQISKVEESAPHRELIRRQYVDADGKERTYAYTAEGFAPANVIERANAIERELRARRIMDPRR